MRGSTKLRLIISAALSPFLVVLYLNIEKWAEKKGLDLILANLDTPEGEILLNPLFVWTLHPAMAFLSVGMLGFVAGIWFDAWIRREDARRATRFRELGERCLDFVQDARVRSHNQRNKDADHYHRLWAVYLPIVSELEDLHFTVLDPGITGEQELQDAINYCQFVGNLLKNGQTKIAKITAKSLTPKPNQSAGLLGIRWLLSTAQRTWQKINPG